MSSNFFDLTGQGALVTGGAQGIGSGIARRLGRAGAAVAVADLNQEGADAYAAELTEQGITAFGIRVADVENSVGRKIDHQVVSDGRTVVYALNRGVPFVWSNSQAPVSEDILKISRALVSGEGGPEGSSVEEPAPKKSLFGRR